MTSAERKVPDVSAAIAGELRHAVTDALRWLRRIGDAKARERPRAGAWSSCEIIGHLIDSASNNHGRFVRGALADSLVFPTYDQEAWVTLQGYQEQPWPELLTRWESFNAQVAAAIEHIPASALTRERREHNFDRIAWQTIPANQPATLEYFVRDYIGHLRHHLAQIAALAAAGDGRKAQSQGA